jgi:hypothetical protein
MVRTCLDYLGCLQTVGTVENRREDQATRLFLPVYYTSALVLVARFHLAASCPHRQTRTYVLPAITCRCRVNSWNCTHRCSRPFDRCNAAGPREESRTSPRPRDASLIPHAAPIRWTPTSPYALLQVYFHSL